MKYVTVALVFFAAGAIADINVENPSRKSSSLAVTSISDTPVREYNAVPSRSSSSDGRSEAEASLTDHLTAELKVETRPDRVF